MIRRLVLLDDAKRKLDEHLVFVPSDEVIDPDYETTHPGRHINDPENMQPIPTLEPGILPPYDLSQDPDHTQESLEKRLSGHFRRFDIAERKHS
ncbi:MAG: hypothetical protein H6799_00760 [Candidatus Nomurabacteria bacterium]|nr:MAG: hypothetical protein H6799_00760 [Candidatus Nomurabacteria bacterium]